MGPGRRRVANFSRPLSLLAVLGALTSASAEVVSSVLTAPGGSNGNVPGPESDTIGEDGTPEVLHLSAQEPAVEDDGIQDPEWDEDQTDDLKGADGYDEPETCSEDLALICERQDPADEASGQAEEDGDCSCGCCDDDESCCTADQVTAETNDVDDEDGAVTTDTDATAVSTRRLLGGSYTAPLQQRQAFLWQLGSALGAGGSLQDIALGGVDLASSLGESEVSVGAPRALLADQEAVQVAFDTQCFGDRSAGCCGALQCEVSNATVSSQVNVRRAVTAAGDQTQTRFDFVMTSITSFGGRSVDQLAMLFTIDTMAELSVAQSGINKSAAETHIGCNPLDGYIAWRQTLGCATCSSDPEDEYKYSVTVQGDKCLADICRPVALPHGEGSLSVLQPLSDADKSCCLMTVQSDDDGEQQCQLLQVCEGKSDTQEPLPAPEPEPAASCQRWQLRAFPVNNDGSDFVLYSADRPGEQEGEGAAIRDGLKDVTLTKYIDADGINFGPHVGGLAELHDAEEAVHTLLRNDAFRRYSLQDWSLGVELSSYLCMPGDGDSQELDFQIQASGEVVVRIAQGEDAATITYAHGCQGVDCAWARAERSRAAVASGCSRVTITFRDRGELHKWLHVNARLVSEQCTGSPKYAACAGAEGTNTQRRLSGVPSAGASDAWESTALAGVPMDAAFEGPSVRQRALLVESGALNETDGRTVSISDVERQDVEDGGKEPLAAASQGDEEDGDVADIDEAIDLACSVFKAAVFLHPGDGVCPDPAQPALCDTCHRSWLAEVYQFKSRQEPWKVWKATRVLHKKIIYEQPKPVHSFNVDEVWFPQREGALVPAVPDDYTVRYTSFVCFRREVDVQLLICSSDDVVAHIDGRKVFFRSARSGPQVRCWKSRGHLRLAPGCHHASVMHAHSGGTHGITLRLKTRHSWRCARGGRVPPRFLMHPRACQCAALPPDAPLELDAPPDPPPPPPLACPAVALNAQGWELCAWKLDRTPSVPDSAQDLEGIIGLNWYQDKDAEWAKQQCRSLPYINFHTRNRCQPIAHDYGLAGFKALFAMRARTQLRVDETFSAAIRIYSNDGFALSIHEVGTFTGDGDTFYEDYKVLGKLAHPQQTTCKAFTLAAVTFESGKIYAVDVKYYQTSGDKCLKVLIKHTGSCAWNALKGDRPPLWSSQCPEPGPPPLPPPPPPPPSPPLEPAACHAWRVRFWHTSLQSLSSWVRHCHCLCDILHLLWFRQLRQSQRTHRYTARGTSGEVAKKPALQRVQSSVVRIAKGAPDFETLAESLEWQGPHPERSGDAALYKPVRSAPGWSVFKKGFFMRADATICVPERYSALQVETSHKGRVRVLLNDEKLIDDDRSSCDEGNWRSAATRSLTNVAGKCVSVSVFYVHRAGQSALKIYHRLGFAKFGRAYFPKLPGRAALRGDVMSDEREHRVSLRHPESGAIDCTLPVTTCAGPCCGTCNPSEVGLIATGNKVDFVALWQDEGSLGLQFRVSRGRLGKDIASKWKDVQQLQLLTNDDAFACLAAADAAKHGCKAAPSIISQAEAPCSATSGHRGILFDISALTKSSTFAIKRPAPVATESPITYGLEHICAQNVLPLQQAVMDKKGYKATCAVLITFRHGGCAYAVFGSEKQFTTDPPLPPSPPPPLPPAPPPPANEPVLPKPPDACECEGSVCAGATVCPASRGKVHLSSAKVYLSKPSKCLKGKQFMFLNFVLRDMHSDTGVKRVNLFVKGNYANFALRHLQTTYASGVFKASTVSSPCSKYYSKPAVSHGGCSGYHSSTAISWTSGRTPPPGRSMSYTVVVPYATDVDLGLMCHQLNPKYPKKSCVLAVDRLVNGQRCSVVYVLYQKSCALGSCFGHQSGRRLLAGRTYGELAADYATPHNWIPVDSLSPLHRIDAQPSAVAAQELSSVNSLDALDG